MKPVPSARRASRRIDPGIRARLINRLEIALAKGHLRMTCSAYATLLLVLFPEDFAEAPAGEPTDAPPLSKDRIAVYADRFRSGRPVKDDRDTCPARDDSRAMRPRPHGGKLGGDVKTFRADGWAEEVGEDGER